MSQNLSSAAVVIGALRVNKEQNRVDYGTYTFKVYTQYGESTAQVSAYSLACSAHWNQASRLLKLEVILRLKIKRNDWLLADMCPQAANHCALF